MKSIARHWGLLFALLIATVTLLPFSVVELGRDQANWLTIAMAIEHGSIVYRDVAFVNTPGLGFIFAAVNKVFGHPTLTPWIVHVAMLLSIISAGYSWAFRMVSPAAATGAALVCALLLPQTLDWWDIAQKDGLAFAFALISLASLAAKHHRNGWAVAAGIMMSAAVLTKPTAGLYLIAIIAQIIISTENAKYAALRFLFFALGGLLPVLVFSVYLTVHGAWEAFHASLFERATAYGGFARRPVEELLSTLEYQVTLSASFVLLIPLLFPRDVRQKFVHFVPIVLIVIAAASVFVIQGKGWKYHSVPTTASLILLSGMLFGGVISERSHFKTALATGLVVLSIFKSIQTFGSGWVEYAKRFAGVISQEDIYHRFRSRDFAPPEVSKELADWIASVTEPTDRIFVWGMESQIYVYSNRMFVGPSFADGPIWHPQLALKAPEYFNHMRKRFFTDLQFAPPAVFVVVQNDATQVEPWPSDRSFRSLPEVSSFIEENYKLEKTKENFLVYKRL